MARGPRLDAPGALHHVRARGIERGLIFFDDGDREDFLGRLGRLVENGALRVYAWALMPNHFHLLVRTCAGPLERSMRSLLAGYATCFNRRRDRAGHLFQNRYKSTLCEDEPYFLSLVQYIHLNPVPSVVSIEALADYRYAGHSVLLGTTRRAWQDTEAVLNRFAECRAEARDRYAEFIAQGTSGARPDLEGGGVVHTAFGHRHVATLQKGRERFSTDERLLATQPFVDRTLGDLSPREFGPLSEDHLIEIVCNAVGVSREAVAAGGRAPDVSRARRGISYLWTLRFGRSGRAIARRLGVSPTSVYESSGARAGRGRGMGDGSSVPRRET